MEILQFKATDEQLKRIGLLAINASLPMGVGLIHYQDKYYTLDDIKNDSRFENGISIDYFDGRMVKLFIIPIGNDWYTVDNELNIDYQSFKRIYADMKALIASVDGIEVIETQEPIE